MPPRLESSERRTAIIDAALPLFAQKGFAVTTTREIAQAAGVSEALIFKHFPTKAALYEALLNSCLDGDPELERLMAAEPSTAALVDFVRSLLDHFVVQVPASPSGLMARHRLMVTSFLEDGEFARLVYRWIADHIHPRFTASIRAARAAGDAVAGPMQPENGLWFAEHLGSMLATVCLSGRAIVPHPCKQEDLARQAAWFILRGLGLKDEAIAAHLDTTALP